MATRVGTGARLWNGSIALAFDWGGASDTRIEERLSDWLVEILEWERVRLAAG